MTSNGYCKNGKKCRLLDIYACSVTVITLKFRVFYFHCCPNAAKQPQRFLSLAD
ncbi:hypothetical protein HMPREF0476_2017 [Kingella kingae ATCC 23330]|uniref:Uncharacterized protein n=1 Tax=Kingella kingae ATCC 23330 TaxID=887327 RepID=F5S9Y4_KINKI|nr:hypothetical protein HMPREF0476_2017 [Kingella kingae ATCC 23330]